MGPLDVEIAFLLRRQWLLLRKWSQRRVPLLDGLLYRASMSCSLGGRMHDDGSSGVQEGKASAHPTSPTHGQAICFIPWTDEEWYELLTLVIARREHRGVPSRQCRLSSLAREVRILIAEEG